MTCIVCTLFEGHYHYGVAALTNSLFRQGYRGEIFAGYKGTLPFWTSRLLKCKSSGVPNSQSYEVADGLKLHFVALDTEYHLTNFKPDFLLNISNALGNKVEALFYFDPDIVVTAPWSYFEWWVNSGVALCEDVNSPLSEHHPRRTAWRTIFGNKGFILSFKNSIYVNGGFLGISLRNSNFLNMWQKLQETMSSEIGGLSRSSLNGKPLLNHASGPYSPFNKTDQDALNATIESWTGVVSYLGKEGMSFKPGTPVMLHALGEPKPWFSKPVFEALKGRPPRLVDKRYWDFLDYPIKIYSSGSIKTKKLKLNLAAFIGRFYRRGDV